MQFLKRWVFKEPSTESFILVILATVILLCIYAGIVLLGGKFIVAIVLMGLCLMVMFIIANILDHYDISGKINKMWGGGE